AYSILHGEHGISRNNASLNQWWYSGISDIGSGNCISKASGDVRSDVQRRSVPTINHDDLKHPDITRSEAAARSLKSKNSTDVLRRDEHKCIFGRNVWP